MINHPNEVARRARAASFGLVAIFLILGGAFFRTQILQYRSYALQSEKNRLRPIPIQAPRGTIRDRNGEIIAENIPGFKVSLDVKSLDSLRMLVARFSELVPLEPRDIERITKKSTFDPNRPTVVMANATIEQVALLEEHKVTEFPGGALVIEAAPKRFYPYGRAVASFVGYTSEIDSAQLASEKFAGYKRGQQVGESGLEENYEFTLAGIEGRRFDEKNSLGHTVRTNALPVVPAEAGEDLRTNIDLALQRYIADSVFLPGMRGGVLVMNPESGEVHALYSAPSINSNDFIGGISFAKFDSINADKAKPMYNKVIQAGYPPASTYKLVTAIIGLEAGLVTMDEKMAVPCRGSFRLGNRDFHCWKKEGHGALDLAGAIANSCNVYFFQLGKRLTIDRLLEAGNRYGFSSRSGIDIPREEVGDLPASLDYYYKKWGKSWSAPAEELNLSIGQGNSDQTVANMAKFYSAIAYDGWAATPQIIRGQPPKREQIFRLAPAHMAGVREALKLVVTSGTAAGAQMQSLEVAGKTGTAQNSQGPDHGWFVGFAPADKPTLLVSILIEHGLHGSDAARYAQKIFAFHFKKSVQIKESGG